MDVDPVAAHYDERAATYDDSSLHRGLTEAVADFVGEPGHAVLDVATGTGLMLRSLAARHATLELTGVDIAPAMLAVARASLPGATLLRADAARLPLPSGSVDLITCVTALHLLPDAGTAFAEWARVLRPDGRVVTATFADAPAQASDAPELGFPRRHDLFRTTAQVAGAASGAGLNLTRHTTWVHDTAYELLICELRR